MLGARLLSGIADDRTRFSDAHGLKAFAGTTGHPLYRHEDVVTSRVVRNKRL